MSNSNDPFDGVADLQSQAYRNGLSEGELSGKQAACKQGFQMGQKIAFNVAGEMGQYAGACEMYRLQNQPCLNEKGFKLASQICELVDKFDFSACHADSFTGNLTLIRDKYRQFCSLTNTKNYVHANQISSAANKLMF